MSPICGVLSPNGGWKRKMWGVSVPPESPPMNGRLTVTIFTKVTANQNGLIPPSEKVLQKVLGEFFCFYYFL
ncbi:hypothetical protein [Thermococcus celer]|uniref:hypothetical protein n=1 Tax=Thermococcus celer TaxID=2264 RepID=UPI0012FF7972|nr:hypothetical protein [Thermococcus celer]